MCARVFKIKGDFIQHGKTCKPPALESLTEQDVVDMIKNTSSSDGQVLSMISDLKKKYGNNYCYSKYPDLAEEQEITAGWFFEVKSEVFFDKCGKEKRANVVFCKNTNDFIKFVNFESSGAKQSFNLCCAEQIPELFVNTKICMI